MAPRDPELPPAAGSPRTGGGADSVGPPTYVIDLETGAWGDPVDSPNALDQFLSELDDPPVVPVRADEPQSGRLTPVHASAASRWVDSKTVMTVAITVAVTASVTTFALRFVSDGPPLSPPLDRAEAALRVDRASFIADPPPARDGSALTTVPDGAHDEATGRPTPGDTALPQAVVVRPPPPRSRDGSPGPMRPEPASRTPPSLIRNSVVTQAGPGASTTTRTGTGLHALPAGSRAPVPTGEPPFVSSPEPSPEDLALNASLDAVTALDVIPPADPIGAVVPAEMAPGRIHDVLNRYQAAFSALDAGAARAVWPSVDAGALRRAFDGLETQRVDLQECEITVADTRAVATCGGTLRYVPKVGRKSERVEHRRFQFDLRRENDVWAIEQVESR